MQSSQSKFEYVYYLTDSSKVPKYVGVTNNLDRRLGEHIDEAKSGKQSLKCGWIRNVTERGEPVQIVVLETVPYGQLDDLEHFWIDELGWSGVFLLNSKNGNKPKSDTDFNALRDQIDDWKTKCRNRPKTPLDIPTYTRAEIEQKEASYQKIKDLYDAGDPQVCRRISEIEAKYRKKKVIRPKY